MSDLPLIDIAEGRKVRARRAPKIRPRESVLHAQVAAILRDHILEDWRWTHISAKATDAREGAILKIMGVVAGWPDFVVVSKYGSVRFLELKRDEKSPSSDAQKDFRLWCIRCGIPHVVAWNIDQVLEAFRWWKCTRFDL